MPSTQYIFTYDLNGKTNTIKQHWKLDKKWAVIVHFDAPSTRSHYPHNYYKEFAGAKRAAAKLQNEGYDDRRFAIVEVKLAGTKQVLDYWERSKLVEKVERSNEQLEVLKEVIADETTIDGKAALQRLIDKYELIAVESQATLDADDED
jgi:hypothetical protein